MVGIGRWENEMLNSCLPMIVVCNEGWRQILVLSTRVHRISLLRSVMQAADYSLCVESSVATGVFLGKREIDGLLFSVVIGRLKKRYGCTTRINLEDRGNGLGRCSCCREWTEKNVICYG